MGVMVRYPHTFGRVVYNWVCAMYRLGFVICTYIGFVAALSDNYKHFHFWLISKHVMSYLPEVVQ